MGLFTDLFSTKPPEEAAAAKQKGLETANLNAGADLTAGQAGADALYGKSQDAFGHLVGSTEGGAKAYGDATGANGAEGIARAGDQFKTITGYNGGLNTGLDQLERRAAQRGDLGGGNTSADTIRFASDYDNTHFKDYTAGLAPYLGAHANAVAGEAGAYGQQAGADLNVAGARATNSYNTAAGIGNAKADAALAPYTASQNFWGALSGAANLAIRGGSALATGGASEIARGTAAQQLAAGTRPV